MTERAPGKIIYIGSIPYDHTEEQVLDIAKSIGPVVNLKMMFDKETGRSKGYAFVEYRDIETASSAVRNLNNYAIGNRQLKCDFSWENSMSSVGSVGNNRGRHDDGLPPLPSGRSLNPGETYAQAITQSLNQIDDSRRQQIIDDSIKMAKKNPLLLEELLSQCPQLSYAIVEVLLTTGRADPQAIQQFIVNAEYSDSTAAEQTIATPTESAAAVLSEEERATIKQIVGLDDGVVATLPDQEKEQVLEIKRNYQAGLYGKL